MGQVSAPVRIVALVGMLAALAVGAWAFTAGQAASTHPDTAGAGTVAANPIAAAQSVAGRLSAHNNATAAGRPDATPPAAAAARPKAAASAAAAAAAKPAAGPKPVAPKRAAAAPHVAAPNETPTTIASLLGRYPAVVVLLYDPQAQVDAYSVSEAELGAKNAHVGFVRVDVMNQRQTAPFTQAYGVLQDPSILFFARPGKLVQKLSGFADNQTVTQAALNAAIGIGSAPSSGAGD